MCSLAAEFHVERVDESELAQLILDVYPVGMQASEVVVYRRSDGPDGLTFTYKNGKIDSITPGSGFRDEDRRLIVQRIRAELLSSDSKKVGRAILFSTHKVKGSYALGDHIRIMPIPSDAPHVTFAVAEHPFILEFRFDASCNDRINALRRYRAIQEFALVLNVFARARIRFSGMRHKQHWVMVPQTRGVPSCNYYQEGYGFESFEPEATDFLQTKVIPQISRLSPNEYYAPYATPIYADSFELPDSIDELLYRYLDLPEHNRRLFLQAAFWFEHAVSVHQSSLSVQLVSLIHAIETLAPPSENNNRCVTCDRPYSTDRVRSFITNLLGNRPEVVKFIRRIYKIRSKLTHGGELLRSDTQPIPISLNPLLTAQGWETANTSNFTRSLLISWLLS